MTDMFGEAWSPMSVPDLAPDDDEYDPAALAFITGLYISILERIDLYNRPIYPL